MLINIISLLLTTLEFFIFGGSLLGRIQGDREPVSLSSLFLLSLLFIIAMLLHKQCLLQVLDYLECLFCQPVNMPSRSYAGTECQPCNSFLPNIGPRLTCIKCSHNFNNNNPCFVCLEWDEGQWVSFHKLELEL